MRAVSEAWQKTAAARVKENDAEPDRTRAALAEAGEVLRRRLIGLEQYPEAPATAVYGLWTSV